MQGGRTHGEGDGGFTLIELMVVIIIIGILAAIAIPVFLDQRQKGYDAQAKSDLRNVASLEESYATNAGSYTTTISDACTNSTALLCYRRSPHASLINASYTDAFGTVTTTPGVTTFGYCLWTYADSEQYWYFNSLKGGLQPTAAC